MKVKTKKINLLTLLLLLASTSQSFAKFDLFASHPYAHEVGSNNDQIEDLMLYNGTIYAGYGTHNNHPYTSKICGFTPPSKSVTCPTSVDSEGIGHFRKIDNILYIAGIDPKGSKNHFYARKSGNNWFSQPAFTNNVAHIYDIERSNNKVFVTLTKFDDDARVMKGTDNGQWVESLYVTPETGHTTSNYSVLFFIAKYNGKLYTQAFDTQDGIRPYSFVSSDEGITWNRAPNIMLHSANPNGGNGQQNFRHEIFNNLLIMKQNTYLTTFDGSISRTIREDIRNFTIKENYLYILEESGKIYRTTNLSAWDYVDTAPSNASSIEILGNDIYVGTENANIYRSKKNNTITNIIPILQILILDKN